MKYEENEWWEKKNDNKAKNEEYKKIDDKEEKNQE